MTKAKLILKLYDGVRTTREIALIVGTTLSYVRTVARQRKGKSRSEHDRRYLASPLGKKAAARAMTKWWQNTKSDPKRHARYLVKHAAYKRARYWVRKAEQQGSMSKQWLAKPSNKAA